jgi:uncharacterized membrane protein
MATFNRALAYFLIFGVAAYSVYAYTFMPIGAAVYPDMKPAFISNSTAIHIHVFSAVLALALGPLQFSANIRRKHPKIHRWSGRIYLGIGVLVGGLAGLYIARHAHGGIVAQVGFSLLALLWLYTGARAYLSVRSGAFEEHRQWMVRNYALTLAAVTLRLYVPAAIIAGFEFAAAYQVIAWLCWAPNLLVAEWRYVRA